MAAVWKLTRGGSWFDVVAFLALVGALFYAGSSYASFAQYSGAVVSGITYGSPTEACGAWYSGTPGTCGTPPGNGTTSMGIVANGGAYAIGGTNTSGSMKCVSYCNRSDPLYPSYILNSTNVGFVTYTPANSTCSSGTCSCGAGYSQYGASGAEQCALTETACTPNSSPVGFGDGLYGDSTTLGANGLPSNLGTACTGGKRVDFNPNGSVVTRVVGGQTHYAIRGAYTYVCEPGLIQASRQQPCVGTPGAPVNPGMAPTSCGSGQTMGVVNGQTLCFNADGSQANPNTSAPPATSTPTDTIDGPNTITTTLNADGTTTRVTRDTSTGRVIATEILPSANPDSHDTYCVANPTSPLCKSSQFGGTCGAFTCNGDAAACAAAVALQQINCELTTPNAASDLGNAAAAGADPLASTFPNPAAPTVTAVGSSLDQSTFLSGSCPADLSIAMPFGWAAFVIPFSSLCAPLTAIGYALVAIALIIAARTIGVF